MEIKKKTKMEKVKKNKDMKEKVGQKQGFRNSRVRRFCLYFDLLIHFEHVNRYVLRTPSLSVCSS